MKLVQKTLLASALAVAFSGAAFADVTVSGKVALEIQGISNVKSVKDANEAKFASDGLGLNFAGVYDILGGNQGGFNLETDMNKSTWRTGETVKVDKANVFFSGDWGKITLGRVGMPSDGVATDYFDNTQVAASDFHGVPTGSANQAGSYEFGGEGFSVGVGLAVVNDRADASKTFSADQLVSDIAGSVNIGEIVTLKAGYQYDAGVGKKSGTGVAGVEANLADLGLGIAANVSGRNVKSLKDGKDALSTDVQVGVKYAFNDVITAKGAFAFFDLGDANGDTANPSQFSLGVDFALAKNIVAFVAGDIKHPGVDDADPQLAGGAGVTVKF